MSCRTCETLGDLRRIHREVNAERKTMGIKPRKNKVTAALVDRTYGGRLTYYSAGGRRIPLNYCPECGRQIRKTKGT